MPMVLRRTTEIDGQPMDLPGVSGVTMRMLVGRDQGAPNFAMRHFTVEPGGHTPRHTHGYEHEVLVLTGAARVEHDGEFHDVQAGDALLVQPHATHQFVNNRDEPFTFICLVPGTDDCGGPTPGS